MVVTTIATFFENIFDFFVDDVLPLTIALGFFFIAAWIVPKIWTMISRGLLINRQITKASSLFLRILITIVGIGLSFAAIGLDVSQLVATLGIVGIVIGLGLQQLLALLAAGVIIRSTDVIREQDTVIAGSDIEGIVFEIGSLYTKICRVDGTRALSIVPNTYFVSTTFKVVRHDRGHQRALNQVIIDDATNIIKIIRYKEQENKKLYHTLKKEGVILAQQQEEEKGRHNLRVAGATAAMSSSSAYL